MRREEEYVSKIMMVTDVLGRRSKGKEDRRWRWMNIKHDLDAALYKATPLSFNIIHPVHRSTKRHLHLFKPFLLKGIRCTGEGGHENLHTKIYNVVPVFLVQFHSETVILACDASIASQIVQTTPLRLLMPTTSDMVMTLGV